MKVVLDSNVLLAALGTRGLCEAVLEACLAGHEICLSRGILEEVTAHLATKFGLTPVRIGEIARLLETECTLVEPATIPSEACRDPDDLMVLGTAVAAGAACIVTGDRDLLVLRQYLGIPILSPRDYHQQIGAWAPPE